MDTVTIPANTLIHWQGIPFRTLTDTEVEGTQPNVEMAQKLEAEMPVGATAE